jgi:hypothetical protein
MHPVAIGLGTLLAYVALGGVLWALAPGHVIRTAERNAARTVGEVRRIGLVVAAAALLPLWAVVLVTG